MKRYPGFLVIFACFLLAAVAGQAPAREKAPTLRELKAAVAAHPNDPEAHYRLGLKYQELGQSQRALKALQQAVRLKPDYFEAYLGLGQVRGELGEPEAAAGAYKRALGLKPGNEDARALLGDAYIREGMALLKQDRGQEAITAFQEGVKVSPNPVAARNNLGVAYYQTGRLSEAKETFEQVLGEDANNPQALYNLGVVNFLRGDEHTAYQQYFNLKSIDPEAAGELSALLFTPRSKADYAPQPQAIGLRPSPVLAIGRQKSSYSTQRSW